MTAYIDTALFVKSFVRENDSTRTVRLLEEIGEPFAYSHLHELEIPNAIRLKRFRGEITLAQETAAIRAFCDDVETGRFERIHYDLDTVFARAEQLSAKYSAEIGCRSLDLWHVAAATVAEFTSFVSYDVRQRKAAELSGLQVLPPKLK
ncbi:MAG: type II toxin-antitoxin system VapC family toxin [Verrucomicrobiaceae bacterium]|nr:type II toxin-antitoxin system VapC family toxin [Verrucomicrobiaceae bacterium]